MELERSFRIYFDFAEPERYTNCDRYIFSHSEQHRFRLYSFNDLYHNGDG
jgi:hypothetical protein